MTPRRKKLLDNTNTPCYIYYDRCTTTVVATTDKVTTAVVKLEEQNSWRTRQGELGKEMKMIEISSDIIRGYNDTMILFLLKKEPSYGYELSKQIKNLSDGKYIIKETTLYSAFSRMEKNGYIESFVSESDAGKKRTYYRITEAGIQYYNEKCEEWQLTKEVVERFVNPGG